MARGKSGRCWSFRFRCLIRDRRAPAGPPRSSDVRSRNTTRSRSKFAPLRARCSDRAQGARDRALYYRDIMLPLHERIVNETQLHYNAMQLGPVQLLRAREQQIETGAAYVEALRDYWMARTELAQLLSGRLPAGGGARAGEAGAAHERRSHTRA